MLTCFECLLYVVGFMPDPRFFLQLISTDHEDADSLTGLVRLHQKHASNHGRQGSRYPRQSVKGEEMHKALWEMVVTPRTFCTLLDFIGP